MRLAALVFPAALPAALAGCTTFANVRSADVRPGPSLGVQASASTNPGDGAGWFWAYDCATACGRPVVGGDVGVTYGWRPRGGARAASVGAGVSGAYPYVDGYVQLAAGRRPFGVGARLGPPATSWREHQVYARQDVPLGRATRLLLNPGVFLHEGRAPNGENPGRFLGFVQGIGVLFDGERASWTPAVALVAGRAERTSFGRREGPTTSVFATASLGVTLHRRSEPDGR